MNKEIEKNILYKGRKLETYSKEELIEIVNQLSVTNLRILDEKKHERTTLLNL